LEDGWTRKDILKSAGALALVMGVLWGLWRLSVTEELEREALLGVLEGIRGRAWAPIVFVSIFALGLGLGGPASLFTLLGGVVFGVWPGALYNWLGTFGGACLAFLVARYLGRDVVTRVLQGRLDRFDEKLRGQGFWAIFVMRLIPVVPFNLSNFAAGLTRIRFVDYALATGLAIFPGVTVATYFAHALWLGTRQREALLHVAIASALMLGFALGARWLQRRTLRNQP